MSGTVEETGKVATSVIEALRSQPLALATSVVNLLFLLGGLWFLHEIAALSSWRQARNDQLMSDLVHSCKGFEQHKE